MIGTWFHQSLAVINQKNDVTSNKREASYTATPVPSGNGDQFSASQFNSKNNLEARISNFEATTPVFPLTAPTYDYSPSGLNPPESDEISNQLHGYSNEAPSTTPTIPLYEQFPIESQPAYDPSNVAYLPPKKTTFVIPKPPSAPFPPSKPSYIYSSQPIYREPFKQTNTFPAQSKPIYDFPLKSIFNLQTFQHYPAAKTQQALPKFQYDPSRPDYQPSYLQLNVPSSQFSSPGKLQPTYLHSKKSYSHSPSSQHIEIPTKFEGGNLPSKHSAYNNLKYNIYSLLNDVPRKSSSDIRSPPTPPVISYDGWTPLNGIAVKDLQINSFIPNGNPQASENYLGLDKFEIGPSLQQLQQLFPPSDNYYDSSLKSANQPLSSGYEPPFDFIESFSNLASTDNGGFDGPSSLSNNVFQISPNHLRCDELSVSQIAGNICCSPSQSTSGVLGNGYQTLSPPIEHLGLAYGVPSGKQIDGPKLQPKVPVKFRPPVPSGLLESIGKSGQKGVDYSLGFRGQTYIPPAIPEVSKSSELSSDKNDNSNRKEQISRDPFEKDVREQLKEITSNADFTQLKYDLQYGVPSKQTFNKLPANLDAQSLIHGLESNDEQAAISSSSTQLSSFGDEQMQNTVQVQSVDGGILGDQVLSRDLLQQILLAIEQQNQPPVQNAFYEKSVGLQGVGSDNTIYKNQIELTEYSKSIPSQPESIHWQRKRNIALNDNEQKLDRDSAIQS